MIKKENFCWKELCIFNTQSYKKILLSKETKTGDSILETKNKSF